ncbi:MAG: DUF3467 domain-containing protein [Bacteroidetes bacterium CG02_land_8_20_14_3_00_31_25]|nr:DUF3467 domain-containing protein [Bacteroidota bacterium]PIV57965.1 MAG: DUF3467 domain-containing protein [Bacteroidetes bacterium CG02_land_8_20_14_3_00_31_25]PIX32634.1 MAG: DUF3467 domain-containing protein [Bacteroidetes bacterium CG_4_8_14_3_um_filter_31_14]PIY02123.1 MAG: DUF3467 domain-containing protein [Bacteroidetes bacterium CG_4_10_14_3_um_filter_31_20]
MGDNKNIKNGQMNIELDEETAQGIYSNLAVITHSSSEFIIDFVRIVPGVPKAKVKSRIILTPEHAKRLLFALKENLTKFESQFGTVKVNEMGPILPMNFGGPTGEA